LHLFFLYLHKFINFMQNAFSSLCAAAAIATSMLFPLSVNAEDVSADRIARLEARLLELESRLANTEQETKEVKVLAASNSAGVSNSAILNNTATLDILAGSAWRNLRWTQPEQWTEVRRGISEEKVIELLGSPPRSVKSAKPRVDKVAYYETSIRDRSNTLRGKVSYRGGKVIAVQKPDFKARKQAQ
jgi:hypothetical protein